MRKRLACEVLPSFASSSETNLRLLLRTAHYYSIVRVTTVTYRTVVLYCTVVLLYCATPFVRNPTLAALVPVCAGSGFRKCKIRPLPRFARRLNEDCRSSPSGRPAESREGPKECAQSGVTSTVQYWRERCGWSVLYRHGPMANTALPRPYGFLELPDIPAREGLLDGRARGEESVG